jgi:hypothetical protein
MRAAVQSANRTTNQARELVYRVDKPTRRTKISMLITTQQLELSTMLLLVAVSLRYTRTHLRTCITERKKWKWKAHWHAQVQSHTVRDSNGARSKERERESFYERSPARKSIPGVNFSNSFPFIVNI